MEEKLKIIPGWLMTFLLMDFVIVMIIIFAVSKNDEPRTMLNMMLIIGAVFTLVFLFLNFIHYKVKMEYRNFNVKMVPFSQKGKIIESEEVVAWRIRPLRVMREFNGLGKRIKGDTTAYVTDSKFAIEFDLVTGKKLVVSIRNQKEWHKILERSSVWAEKSRSE